MMMQADPKGKKDEWPAVYMRWEGPGYYAQRIEPSEEGIVWVEVLQVEKSRENYAQAQETARKNGLSNLRWANTPEEAASPYKAKIGGFFLYEL
jgi:hypothetical protein